MTHKRFILADTHFGHDRIYGFRDASGCRLRPWADSAAEADEIMIEAWNKVVRQQDIVLHLGDVANRRSSLDLVARLNGRKTLIAGNHDRYRLADYAAHFADIKGLLKEGPLMLQHAPLHPDSIPPWCLANVHGHIHANTVVRNLADGSTVPDTRYFNACVEAIGVAPLEIDEIVSRIERNQELHPPAF